MTVTDWYDATDVLPSHLADQRIFYTWIQTLLMDGEQGPPHSGLRLNRLLFSARHVPQPRNQKHPCSCCQTIMRNWNLRMQKSRKKIDRTMTRQNIILQTNRLQKFTNKEKIHTITEDAHRWRSNTRTRKKVQWRKKKYVYGMRILPMDLADRWISHFSFLLTSQNSRSCTALVAKNIWPQDDTCWRASTPQLELMLLLPTSSPLVCFSSYLDKTCYCTEVAYCETERKSNSASPFHSYFRSRRHRTDTMKALLLRDPARFPPNRILRKVAKQSI